MMQKVQKTPLIHQLFEQQSLQTPDAIAVVFKDEQLTYRQLNEKANQVAHYLKSLNVGPEVRVGVCLERSPEMLIVLLGILKAGSAYVPLDHTHPTERNHHVLEDAQMPLLLTQASLLPSLPQNKTQFVCIDQSKEIIHQQSTDNLVSTVNCDNLAYVMYTSGSTGKPKGVEILHQSVVNFLKSIKDCPGLTPQDILLAVTTITFDISVLELFLPLSVGASVAIATREMATDGVQLSEALDRYNVSVMQATPATWQLLLQSRWQGNSRLKILCGGESLPRELANKLLEKCSSLWNMYGPTETTIWSTCGQVDPGNSLISIGRPIANTQIYLLNQQLQPVAEGEIGELYIGGAGLARGYLNRSELTAERFIQYPVSPNKTERIYKTGDLARYLPDGNLECLGRIDHQVKIRGFRIELGEIESLLWQHQDIESAVVVATEDGLGHKRLVAYVVSDVMADRLRDQSTLQGSLVKSLRGYLQQHLPDYMVPAHFVILDALPLNSNGKVDRNALPSPEQYAPSTSDKLVKPKTTTEEKLTQLWEEILGLKQVSIDDNFYTLGGHSLLAIRLISQINQRFGIELPLASFLVSPTIREIAVAIKTLEQSDLDSTSPLIPDLEKASVLDPTILPNLVAIETIPNIFLTGSTGFLGIYLLYELLQQTSADCYCLVRADSLEAARDKIQQQLKHYQLWENQFDTRIIPILGDLSQPQFGLRSEQFDRLAQKIDVIYHCGAWVNILYPYTALAPTNVTGTQEVLRLASQIKIKPVHFISTVDVFASNQQLQIRTVGEQDPIGSGLQLLSGYAQSKYVAERLVMTAHERGIPTAIYRPSNIMGASNTGICSASSFVSKMIQGCIEMGMAPALSAALNLVPVDYASQAIIHLSLTQPLQGQAFHIVNQSPLMWKDLVSFIHQQGHSLDWVSYEAWYAALRHLVLQTNSEQTLMSLVTLFENRRLIQKSLGAFYFKSDRVLDGLVNTGITCPAPNEKLLMSYLADLTAKNTFGGIHLNQPLVLPSYSQSMTPIMGVIS